MLDLLLDPGFLAIAGTIGGGMGLKFVEKRTTKKVTRRLQGEFVLEHQQKKEIEADPAKSIYACKVYSDRLFEHKLVDAGVMELTEMTICDVERCVYCAPTRNAQAVARRDKHRAAVQADIEAKKSEREKFNELKAKDGRYKGYRYEDYMFQQNMRRYSENLNNEATCVTCNEPGIHVHSKESTKFVKTKGLSIARPTEVPEFAVATPLFKHGDSSPHSILWQWEDPHHGMAWFKQPIETERTDVQNMDGRVVRSVESVYDPDTNEFLGQIEVGSINGHGMTWTSIIDGGTITTPSLSFRSPEY